MPVGVYHSPDVNISISASDFVCGDDVIPDSIVVAIGDSIVTSAIGTLGIHITGLADNDTVTVCAFAHDDCADYCGPNYSDTCWSFTVEISPIFVKQTYPDDSNGDGTTVTSCECTKIRWLVNSSYNVIPESTVVVDHYGIIYDWSSGILSFSDNMDTLIWNSTSVICFDNSDTVRCELRDLMDIMGRRLSEPVGDSFLVDISSPVVIAYAPYPYAFECNPDFWAVLFDSVHRVEHDTFVLSIDGTHIESSLFDWHGDTLFGYYSSYPDSFDWGDTIEICLTAWDAVDRCEPNRLDTCWEVIVTDTIPPECSFVSPPDNAISACAFQEVVWYLTDAMIGIDTSRVWISLDSMSIEPTSADLNYSPATGELTYIPSEEWADGSHIACLDSAYDWFGNTLDSAICASFYLDFTPPEITFIAPDCSTTVHDSLAEIVFTVADDTAEIYWSSLLLIMDEDTFVIEELEINADTIIFDPTLHGFNWEIDDTVQYCVFTTDSTDLCPGANGTIVCCEFYTEPCSCNLVVTIDINDTIACGVDSIDFVIPTTVIGGTAPYTYRWSPAVGIEDTSAKDAHLRIHSPSALYYTITVTDYYNCIVSDSIFVGTSNPIAYAGPDVISCPEEAVTVGWPPIIMGNVVSPVDIFWFDLDDSLIATTETFSIIPDSTIEYVLEIVDAIGCSDRDTIRVIHEHRAPGQFGWHSPAYDDTVELDSIELCWEMPSGTEPIYFDIILDGSYVAYGISDTCFMVGPFLCGETHYWLIDAWNNCYPYDYFHSDSSEPVAVVGSAFAGGLAPVFHAMPCATESCAVHPNPFSPNDDMINDEAVFSYPGQRAGDGKIKIYDLEGRFVRGIEGFTNWDGCDSAGNKMSKGIYIYLVLRNGEVVCKGTIYLAR